MRATRRRPSGTWEQILKDIASGKRPLGTGHPPMGGVIEAPTLLFGQTTGGLVAWPTTPHFIRAAGADRRGHLGIHRSRPARGAKSSSGTISVAADPANVFELFADSPQGWRAIIHLEGDQPAESDDRTATRGRWRSHTPGHRSVQHRPDAEPRRGRAGGDDPSLRWTN